MVTSVLLNEFANCGAMLYETFSCALFGYMSFKNVLNLNVFNQGLPSRDCHISFFFMVFL